jgi:hypothetical protein
MRLTRSRRGWIPILGWTVLAVVSALLARASGAPAGADRVMRGTFGFVVVPLLTYGIVSASLGATGLRAAIRGLSALGASPQRAALASVLVAMAASAIASGLIALAVCTLAHGAGDAPLAADLLGSFGVAVVAGATYASYFALGSAIGKGAMRAVFLAADWILGSGSGFGSVLTPRGHVMSLLGGPPCFELSNRASSVALLIMMACFAGLAVRLARRV